MWLPKQENIQVRVERDDTFGFCIFNAILAITTIYTYIYPHHKCDMRQRTRDMDI